MSNQSKHPIERLSREELDEVFDMMAMGGLDPNLTEGHSQHDLVALCKYLDENNKEFSELSLEEIESFRIKD